MQLQIESKSLAHGLEIVTAVDSPTITQPSLHNVLMRLAAQKLSLEMTDGRISLRYLLPATEIAAGKLYPHGNRLFDLCKDNPGATLTLIDNGLKPLHIFTGKITKNPSYKVPVGDHDIAPTFPETASDPTLAIPIGVLKFLIEYTAFSVGESKFGEASSQSIGIEILDGFIVGMGLCDNGVAVTQVKWDGKAFDKLSIPKLAVKPLLATCRHLASQDGYDETLLVEIYDNPNTMIYKFGDLTIASRKSAAQPINWYPMIVAEETATVIVAASEALTTELKKVSRFGNVAKYRVKGGKLHLATHSADGEANADLALATANAKFSSSLLIKPLLDYLAGVLKHEKSANVSMALSAENNRVHFRAMGADRCVEYIQTATREMEE